LRGQWVGSKGRQRFGRVCSLTANQIF
jgi:hypothetical protein